VAVREDALDGGALHELGDVVNGRVGRVDGDEVTVFKSVRLALEDLAIVAAAAERLAAGGARV
jgi:ornithine cyclodeaminase/alanine dehydrogenase-like protein (mu-crystallin family)